MFDLMISYEDFLRIEIRAGRVVRVEDFPQAHKPAYRLWIDFGELGIKKSSAQITRLYSKKDLMDKTVIAVTNFPPKQIANFRSEVLVLGVIMEDGDTVVLLQAEREIPPGSRIL